VDATSNQRATTVIGDCALAALHLGRAWAQTYRRDPDPKAALDEVVLALQSAGRSIVSPKDKAATLGKMIAGLRSKREKWTVEIGTISQLVERLAALWKAQPRHGVDDPNDVKDVSAALAEAAVQEGLTIVHWFRSGFVRQV
jgi:hypothetical protein